MAIAGQELEPSIILRLHIHFRQFIWHRDFIHFADINSIHSANIEILILDETNSANLLLFGVGEKNSIVS